MKKPTAAPSQGPKAPDLPEPSPLVFRLYVAGTGPNSITAEANLRQCIGHTGALIEIVDLLLDKARALSDGVVVTPTLIRVSPEPTGMLIGNLADQQALREFVGR
jgi:circadian clock protein KaiB